MLCTECSFVFRPLSTTTIALVIAIILLYVDHDDVVVDAAKTAPRTCGGDVRHVHLSVGKDPSTSMIVSFATIPSIYSAPYGGVLVGTSPSALNMLYVQDDDVACSYNLTSPRKGNYDGGNTYFSPHYHHVTIDNLQPSTTYYYRPLVHPTKGGFKKYLRSGVSAGTFKNGTAMTKVEAIETLKDVQQHELDEEGAGRRDFRARRRLLMMGPYDGSDKDCPSPDKIRSFQTAPRPGEYRTPSQIDNTKTKPISFCVVGDIGQFPHSEELISRILRSREDLDAIILAGDIAYSTTDHRRWDTFFDFLDDYPIAEHIPLQIVPGNHDIDKEANGSAIFEAYEYRFRMPRIAPPKLGVYDGPLGPLNMDRPPYPLPYEYGNAYYSFVYGPAHVIMISAYSSMEPDSTQYRWIVSELETKVDRTVTPWVLAVLHTPIYNTFSLHQKDYQIVAAKKHLEPLFVKYRVNMVFTGHIHAYLRTSPVVHEEVHPQGPMHITVGAGGRKCEAPFKSAEPEPWVAVRDATIYGYGMFRIHNASIAEWHWIHTGRNDERDYNEVWHSNMTLPPGPGQDRVYIENQFFV